MVKTRVAQLALTTAGLMVLSATALAQATPPLRPAVTVDGTASAATEDPADSTVIDPLAEDASEEATDIKVLAPPPAPQEPAKRRPTRVRPAPYAPLGLRANVFNVYPSLEMGGVVSTNPRRTAGKNAIDGGVRLRPGLAYQSDWVRHSWSGEANGEFIRFLDKDNPTTVTGSAKTDFRLDIRRTTHADFNLHYDLSQAEAGSDEVSTAALDPRRDHTLGGSAALSHDLGPIETTARLGVERKLFSDVALADGTTENNSDRAYTEPTFSLRGTYKYGALVTPFAEATYAPRFHDDRRDRNGLKRNSQGVTLRAGFSFDDGAVWSGEVAAKYMVRNYADPALDTLQTAGLDGTITWRPSEIATIALSLGTELNESTLATSSGTRLWTARLAMTEALRENLDARFSLGADIEDGEDGTDYTFATGAGLEYKFNPMFSAAADYSGTFFRGSAAGDDWDDHRVIASLIWHY